MSKPWASGATDEEIESLREEVDEFSRAMVVEDRRANKAERERDVLLATLEELLAAESTEMPCHEAGKEAQDAWADRRAAARNNARSLIKVARGQS